MPYDKNDWIRLTVAVTGAEHEAMHEKASEYGLSHSAYVRKLVQKALGAKVTFARTELPACLQERIT